MKIKAFSFEKNSLKTATVKSKITAELTESGVYFESFTDSNELFNEISNSLSNSDAILIGIESDFYLKFKSVIIKAFNFTPAYSEKIENAIGSSITDEKLLKAHTLVPNECAELLSEDGLFSGFFVKSADQYIVVFPLIEDYLPEMLTKSNLPFVKTNESKFRVYEDISSDDKASSKAEALLMKLIKNDIKLAIPATPASKVLKEDIKSCKNYENYIFFTPFVSDDGISEPKEYSAQLSKGAMELRNTELGATISNIFREKKGDKILNYYSFISVATEDKIIVKKLFANGDENVDNLIVEATNELYAMIDKYVDEVIFKKNATQEEKEKYEKTLIEAEYEADKRPSASIGKKGTVAAIITLAVAVIICVILGLKFGGYFVNADDEVDDFSLQAGGTTIPVTTTEPTTEPETMNITEPVVVTDENGNVVTQQGSEVETFSSIFDVTVSTTLTQILNTNNQQIYYKPNPSTTSAVTTTQKEATTKKETTTKKVTTTKPTETTIENEDW
ncbi:MAG: hypothetical protein ACI4IF_03710 [Acutalibacteraceae bacterium]